MACQYQSRWATFDGCSASLPRHNSTIYTTTTTYSSRSGYCVLCLPWSWLGLRYTDFTRLLACFASIRFFHQICDVHKILIKIRLWASNTELTKHNFRTTTVMLYLFTEITNIFRLANDFLTPCLFNLWPFFRASHWRSIKIPNCEWTALCVVYTVSRHRLAYVCLSLCVCVSLCSTTTCMLVFRTHIYIHTTRIQHTTAAGTRGPCIGSV